MGSIFAQNAKNEKKKKINELHNKTYSLYFTISHWNNLSELSEGNTNNNLNDYLKPKIGEYNNLEKELKNWKKEIEYLEQQLKSYIKTEDMDNGFLDIFSLIKSIINNQEEKLNEMKFSNNNIEDLSDLAAYLHNINICGENKHCSIIADKSNIDYNKVNSNISKIIKQLNSNYSIKINEITINLKSNNNNNSIKNNETTANSRQNNNNSINLNDITNNSRLYSNNSNNNNSNNSYSNVNNIMKNNEDENNDINNEFEKKLNNGLNPFNLILNIQEDLSEKELVKNVRNNLDINDCFVLPQYNIDLLINSRYDLNSVEYDNKNAFHKIFNMMEKDDNKLASKKLMDVLESPPDDSISIPSKKREKRDNKDDNLIKIKYDEKYKLLTPLQKLIILHGIFTTGNNPYLINGIFNSYFKNQYIIYSADEMNYICKKILEEIGIEYESNFNNINDYEFNYNKYNSNKFHLYNSRKMDIESACYISEYSDFEYNNTIKKIFDVKDDTNKDEYNKIYYNIKNKDQYKFNSNYNIINKNNHIPIQTSKMFTNIIMHNPYINKSEIKKNILTKVVNYVKDLCEKIKQFQKNNKSKFNYFTGQTVNNSHRQINDLAYKEINENKNKKLNKDDVSKQLKEHTNEFKTFSIQKNQDVLIIKDNDKQEKEDTKTKILSIINSYRDNNIKNNWDKMNTSWYQNNQRFNPIFKINGLTKTNNMNNYNQNNNNNDNNNNHHRNNNENGRTNNNNIFSHLQSLKTNQ